MDQEKPAASRLLSFARHDDGVSQQWMLVAVEPEEVIADAVRRDFDRTPVDVRSNGDVEVPASWEIAQHLG